MSPVEVNLSVPVSSFVQQLVNECNSNILHKVVLMDISSRDQTRDFDHFRIKSINRFETLTKMVDRAQKYF